MSPSNHLSGAPHTRDQLVRAVIETERCTRHADRGAAGRFESCCALPNHGANDIFPGMTKITVTKAQIDTFLASKAFGVAGASKDREKYGNKVLRVYQQNKLKVIPVHPKETEIEGLSCVASVADLPADVLSLSVITPPPVTEKIVEAAAKKGIKNIWMQPGAESPAAIEAAVGHGMNVIADGTCILVVLRYHE